MSEPTPQAPTGSAAAKAKPKARTAGSRRWRGWLIALAVLVVIVLVLGGALYDQNRQFEALRADFKVQRTTDAQRLRDTQALATRAQAQVQAQAQQIDDLQHGLAALGTQVQQLNDALQLMSQGGSDLLLLNDVERLVNMAQQQLRLGGNVANAIISLEAAQAQLARANRPPMAALQQSINGDLDRLRALPVVDFAALTQSLHQLGDWLMRAPMLVPDEVGMTPMRPATGSPEGTPAKPDAATSGADAPDGGVAPGWRGWGTRAWQWTQEAGEALARDLDALFEVRRVSDAQALLISPEQAERLRALLRQRTVTAQLALMMHQSGIWLSELGQVRHALETHYESNSPATQHALRLVQQLLDTPIEVRLPELDNSLDAIAAARDAADAARAAEALGDANGANDADDGGDDAAASDEAGATPAPNGATAPAAAGAAAPARAPAAPAAP